MTDKSLDITIYSEPPPGFATPGSRGWQFDEGFVARQKAREDAEWAAAVAGMNEPQPGADAGKSPLVEGAKTGAQSFVEGTKLAAEGLAEITMGSKEGPLGPLGHGAPVNPMGSLKKVFDGLMSMGLSPFVAAGAAGGQLLENENPALAATTFATGQEALNYRAALAMKAQKDLTPEERTAMSQPMTVREVLETAVTLAGPALAGKAPGALKKAGEFNKKLGQRGAIGAEPPKPEGVTRLYRAEGPGGKGPEGADMFGPGERKGLFFGTREGAENYVKQFKLDNIDAELKYIDLPTEEAARYKKEPKKVGDLLTPGGEWVVPEDVAAGRQPLGSGGAATPPPEPPAGGATPPPGAPPPGGPSPFAEGPTPRVNLARVGAEQAVKDLIAELNVKAQQEGKISARVVSHGETASKATIKQLSVQDALALDYSELHANATALRDLRDLAVSELKRAMSEGAPAAKIASLGDIAGALEAKASATATDVGRGLSAFNILSDAGRAFDGEALAKLAEQRKAGGITDEEYAFRLKKLATKEQRLEFLRGMVSAAARGQNMFYEAWINGLLSNPVTHAGNVVSNQMMASWGIAERQIAGAMNVILRDPEGVHVGEASVMFRAQNRAAAKAMRVAWRALAEGEGPFGAEKMEVPPSIAQAGTWVEGTAIGGFLDGLGAGVRVPSRLLMTEDAYFKSFNYDLAMEARAYREGKKAGLSGDALAKFREDFIKENEYSGSAADAASQEYANLMTFTKDFAGESSVTAKVGTAISYVQKVPMMRLVIPFNRTPVRIGSEAWRRTPVLSLISESLYRDLAEGGERRSLALARVGTSAILAGIFMEYSGSGLMTGGGVEKGDAKAALKDLGRSDYAVHVGDSLYTINRLDPAGMTLGILASYAEIAGQIPEGRRMEFAVAMALAMSEAMKDKPYFMGLATVIEAVENPTAGGKKIVENYTRSIIPAGVRQVRKSGIPGLVEADKARRSTVALTEVEQLLNTLKADVPGYSTTLPAEVNNITGEPIVYPPGWGPDILSPVLVTKLKNDPVFVEIARNKPALQNTPTALAGRVPTGLQMSPDAQTAQGIPLTGQERHRFATIMAKEITDGEGRTLYQAMTALVQSPEYQALETGKGGGRALQMEKLYRVYFNAAAAKLRDESPALDSAVKLKIEDRLKHKAGEGHQPPPLQIAPGLTLPGAGR